MDVFSNKNYSRHRNTATPGQTRRLWPRVLAGPSAECWLVSWGQALRAAGGLRPAQGAARCSFLVVS